MSPITSNVVTEEDKDRIAEYIRSALELVEMPNRKELDWVGPVTTLLLEAKQLLGRYAELPEVKSS